ncbi:MAG: hypothetical protein LBR18_09135 [Tannerella sp.]|jgi:hypothetical protein|nr:hypothetical protein [Tannerella sp.]
MRFKLMLKVATAFNSKNASLLPLSYQYELSAFVYRAIIARDSVSDWLHIVGSDFNIVEQISRTVTKFVAET